MSGGTLEAEAARVLATLPWEPERHAERDPHVPVREPEHDAASSARLADSADVFEETEPSREELRREAARLVVEAGLSVRRAANETGLSPSAVQRAVRAAERADTPSREGEPLGDGDELPEQFSDVATLVRSYQHAARKLHALAAENAAIRTENDELRDQLGQALVRIAELRRAVPL
jgi:transposase-like protein